MQDKPVPKTHGSAAHRTFTGLVATGARAQCLGMMSFTDLTSVPADHSAPFTDQLRLAAAAYLARFIGASRQHTESDLRCYLSWCGQHALDPLAARRPHLELYIRWMQEIRRLKPSTVSRRFCVTAGLYKTCVIDGLLDHLPSRLRPPPHGAPGITHPRIHPPAVRGAADRRPRLHGRVQLLLVAMLGLLGLQIFEATGANITDLSEEHGHRVLRVCGKGTKVVCGSPGRTRTCCAIHS
jgi:integrase/recombinase XerD